MVLEKEPLLLNQQATLHLPRGIGHLSPAEAINDVASNEVRAHQ